MKNKSIGILVLAVFIFNSFLLIVTQAETNTGASRIPDHITLTWTGDPSATQTITWRTDITVNNGGVKYAPQTNSGAFPNDAVYVKANAIKLSSNLGDMNIWSATLTGLAGGQKYSYIVGDGVEWSSPNTFITQEKNTDKFKFLIFGDSQSSVSDDDNYGIWKKTLHNAFQANPDAKFIVNMGDLVDVGQDYAHWNKWYDASAGVIDKISEMAVQGNHETFNLENKSVKTINFVSQQTLPQNGPDGLKGKTYSYDYGNLHISVLDSQFSEEKDAIPNIIEAQTAWLENDLRNTDKQWKIVMYHKTPYYNKSTRTNGVQKTELSPIIERNNVDFVFNAHDHAIARTYPINNDKFVDAAANGTIYYTVGRSGSKYYTDLKSKFWDAMFYDPQAQPNYLVVDVEGAKLTITAKNQDGSIVDSYSVDKKNGNDIPHAVPPSKRNVTGLVVYGELVNMPTIPAFPKQVNDIWYVPVRGFIQYLNGTVTWDKGKIGLVYGKTAASITVDSTSATLNGKDANLTAPIILDNGITFMSAEDIRNIFNFKYSFDNSTNVILFYK